MRKLRKEKYIKTKYGRTATYFTVQFNYETSSGMKTHSKTFTSTDYNSEAKALDAACSYRDKVRSELVPNALSGKKRTVGECLNDYIRIMKVTLGNQMEIKSFYSINIEPEYGFRLIDSITALDIQNSLNAMIYDQSNNNIQRVMSVWRHIFKAAVLEGVIAFSPLERVIVPKSKKCVRKRSQAVSDDAVDKIVSYYMTTGRNLEDKYNNKLIAHAIEFIRLTGLRPAECYAITRSSIDFDNHILHITGSLRSTYTEKRALGATKTPESIRDIPLTESMELVLKSVMEMSQNEMIFMSWDGSLPDSSEISKHIAVVAKRLHVQFHTYGLRHMFATDLVSGGANLGVVKSLMGHKGVAMTLDYTAPSIGDKREVLVEFGRKDEQKPDNKALN